MKRIIPINFFLSELLIVSFMLICNFPTWAQTVISPGGGLELLFIERYVSGANIRYGPGVLYRNYGNGKAWGKARGGRGLPLRAMAETGIDVSSYSNSGFDNAGMSAWTNTEFYFKPFFLKDPPSYLEFAPARIYLNANIVIDTLSTGDNAIAEAEADIAFGYIGDPEHPEFYGHYTESQKIREVLHEQVEINGSMGYIKSANCYSSGIVSGFGLATAKCSVIFDPIIEWDQEEFDLLMGEDTFPLNEYFGFYISNGVKTDECWLDIEPEEGDGDVDGSDFFLLINNLDLYGEGINEDFGRNNCPCLIISYWAFYYIGPDEIEQGPFYSNLIQDSDLLIGSWICDESGMITGTLLNTNVSLTWEEEGEIITLTGTVDGNTMSGTFGELTWRADKVEEPNCDL